MWPVAMGGKGLPPSGRPDRSKGIGAGSAKHTAGTRPGSSASGLCVCGEKQEGMGWERASWEQMNMQNIRRSSEYARGIQGMHRRKGKQRLDSSEEGRDAAQLGLRI